MKRERPLDDTGERLLPTWQHVTVAEHLHRYAVAMSLAAGKDVLDIASGEGYGSNLLGTVAKSVVGVDFDATAPAHAGQRYGRETVRFVRGDATKIPFADASFDLVVSFETIEHLYDHEAMVAELRRVLRDDGMLLISSPDKAYHGDREGYVNTYHVKELYERDFLDLLARHFPVLRHLRQQVLTCSALWPGERTTPVDIATGSFDGFAPLTTLPEPSFHVVLAGNRPLPELPASLFDGTAVARAFADRQETEIANLNAYVASLRQALEARPQANAPKKAATLATAWETVQKDLRTLGTLVWQKLRAAFVV